VLMIRRIRDLLYEQGFTISGARNKLQELAQNERQILRGHSELASEVIDGYQGSDDEIETAPLNDMTRMAEPAEHLKKELLEIRAMLTF